MFLLDTGKYQNMLSIKVNTVFSQTQLVDMKKEFMEERKKKAVMTKVEQQVGRQFSSFGTKKYSTNNPHYSTKVAVLHTPITQGQVLKK